MLLQDSPGLYACSSKKTKGIELDKDTLKKYGLISKSNKSLISYINPAHNVRAIFYSEGDFSGKSMEFSNNPLNGVVNVKFPGMERSNDNVMSMKMNSTAHELPDDCDALEKLVKENMPNLPEEEKGVIEDGIDQPSGSEGRR